MKARKPPKLLGAVHGPGVRADLYDSKADMRAAVLETIRRSGCDCDPVITIYGRHASIEHDDWCAHPAPRG